MSEPPTHSELQDEELDLSPGASLLWYISKYESDYGQSTIPMADRMRRFLSPAARLQAKILATNAQAPRARAVARRLAERPGPLRLHLGCGWNHLPDWVNTDLVGGKVDFAWNLLTPLPFADGTVDAVFTEHVFEHMSYGQTLAVLNDVHRVLKPGGVLRIGVPDAGMYARMYVEEPEALKNFRWNRGTPMLALREVFQEHAHISAYDAETLLLVMSVAGFPNGSICEPGESALLDHAPDLPERWAETVYAEAAKTH